VYNGKDVICAKCHDLFNSGTGDLGWSNYAHEHHADRPVVTFGVWKMSDGTTVTAEARPTASIAATLTAPSLGREAAGSCRNCHVAIPHGWVRPRLIVYSSDSPPYNIGPSVNETSAVGSGQMDGLSAVIGSKISPLTGVLAHIDWSSSQCLACSHHQTPLVGGVWK